jgi:branched-chain amino acid transport system ATP-binding protein
MIDRMDLKIDEFTIERAGFPIVRHVTLKAPPGEITVLLGPNGAGRTTLLEGLAGVITVKGGNAWLGGLPLSGLDRLQRHHTGLSLVEQGRTVFSGLTVEENLTIVARDASAAYEWFPELLKRRKLLASHLSGGEQQMLVLARALLGKPKFLMVDELSLGLAPLIVHRLLAILAKLASDGLGILLVEQYANLALEVGQHAYVMNHGEIVLEGKCRELLAEPSLLRQAYLHNS